MMNKLTLKNALTAGVVATALLGMVNFAGAATVAQRGDMHRGGGMNFNRGDFNRGNNFNRGDFNRGNFNRGDFNRGGDRFHGDRDFNRGDRDRFRGDRDHREFRRFDRGDFRRFHNYGTYWYNFHPNDWDDYWSNLYYSDYPTWLYYYNYLYGNSCNCY